MKNTEQSRLEIPNKVDWKLEEICLIQEIILMEKNKQIISDYMRELGKKGGSKNKEKGREYFVELAKRSHIKRRETKEANQ